MRFILLMTRKRTLSNKGIELFNIALTEKQNKTCMRSLIKKIFTSDFDEKLKLSLEKFRKSSYRLYSYLNQEDVHLIPKYFNNAVVNLVYLILVNDDNVNNINQIKKNISFYFSLANQAFKSNDHNTAILIKAALDNMAIRRLNIKYTKSQKRIIKKFEENYGTFMNCNSVHLKRILENSDLEFLPSVAILLMHYNKTKEYYNCYTKLGHLPENLKDKNEQLKKIVIAYYNKYKNMNDNLQDLYVKEPSDLEFMKYFSKTSNTVNLFEISRMIR